MILKIMDEMTKGTPVSATYLTLWCNTWDNNFVILNKNPDMANSSGFGGQRGEHTWATRMKLLQDLEFIDIKPGKSGPLGNAIIWNPHFILRWHHHIKTPGLTEASYNALIETALEVGVADMTWIGRCRIHLEQHLRRLHRRLHRRLCRLRRPPLPRRRRRIATGWCNARDRTHHQIQARL
jgi:hypothetical protein